MRFGLLGPLIVEGDEGGQVVVRGGIRRSLLTALLLEANTVVSVHRLAEYVWGGAPPAAATASLRNHAMHVRKQLGGELAARIVTRAPGYLAVVRDGELDIDAFRRLCAAGYQAAESADWGRASATFARALRLWRGDPCPDLRCPPAAVHGLVEARAAALLARIDADLHLGRHGEVIAEVGSLCQEHPLSEGFHRHKMLALYRSGYRTEALETYRAFRRVLVDQLGIEPSEPMRELHRRILHGDPEPPAAPLPGVRATAGGTVTRTAVPAPPVAGGTAAARDQPARDQPAPHRPVRDEPVRDEPVRPPRQLPAAVPGFTGRETVLAGLTAALETNGVGVAVCGMGGVGKTALVVRWAHRAAERFPDGQLYVNLRGFDPSADPLDPSAALGIVLEGLGVAAGRIPRNLDARSALYRSLLADKRVLVVLDNARDEQQVRPLLPGGGGRVLITSRRELVGLAAVEGVALINLDVLSGPEARRLLAARLAEPAGSAALHRVAERCGGLPLALSIVAARVASRPVPSLATVAEELRAGGQILDLLATSDITGDVAAVFSWSYRTLSGPAARLFRLLALHPGPDFAPAAAASLAGLPAAATRRLLDELLDAHLLEGKAPDRFTFHDLVRSYARGLAAQDPEAEPARRRLLDHYLGSSEHARTLLYRYSDEPAVIPDRDGVTPETFGHPDAALAWLEAERQCLADLTCYAAEHRIDRYAIELPASTYRYLHGQGRFQEAAVAQRIAVAAAREKDEPAREALALRRLGRSLTGPENRGEAWAALLRALDLTERIGDAVGQARTHSGLGHLAYQDGHHPEALHHHERALDLFRRAGNRGGVALSMNNAAFSRMVLGDAKGAIPLCEEAIAIFAEDDSHTTEPCAWDTLGLAHQRLGDHAEAIRCLRRALELCEETGERWGRAEVLDHLGDAHLAAGDRAAAAAAWRGAIDIIAELDASKAERARAKLAELAAG